jgi:hypothetical protein
VIATLFLASAVAAPVPARQIVFAEQIVAGEQVLVLNKAADLSVLPDALRKKAAGLPILPIGSDAQNGIYAHSQLASRARSLMPVLGPWLAGPFEGTLKISPKEHLLAALCGGGDGGIEKGAPVVVRVIAGPFRIEREATALQHAKAGERLFVRTADGKALTAKCGGDD